MLNIFPLIKATIIPSTYKLNKTKPWWVGKNASTNTAYIGILAPQDINGLISIAIILSFLFSKVLVDIIPGTLHPTETIIETKVFPCNPKPLISLSIT